MSMGKRRPEDGSWKGGPGRGDHLLDKEEVWVDVSLKRSVEWAVPKLGS